jgi:hypothetical protein
MLAFKKMGCFSVDCFLSKDKFSKKKSGAAVSSSTAYPLVPFIFWSSRLKQISIEEQEDCFLFFPPFHRVTIRFFQWKKVVLFHGERERERDIERERERERERDVGLLIALIALLVHKAAGLLASALRKRCG